MKINVNILLYKTMGLNKDKLITIYTETFGNLLQASFGNDFTKYITINIQD